VNLLKVVCPERRGRIQSEMLVKESNAIDLRDGTPVVIRPIRPDDAQRLQSLFALISSETISFRFLARRKELPYEEANRLADVDYQTRMALVATCERNGDAEIIGVARYAVIPGTWPAEAEAAIVVEDRCQGKGLGTVLLERLVAYASAHGIRAFLATVRHDNSRMMRFIRRNGLPTESRVGSGIWEIRVELKREPDRNSSVRRVLKREDGGVSQGRRVTPCLSAIV
jgi:GNAT superfamily N-acetyltransferase